MCEKKREAKNNGTKLRAETGKKGQSVWGGLERREKLGGEVETKLRAMREEGEAQSKKRAARLGRREKAS